MNALRASAMGPLMRCIIAVASLATFPATAVARANKPASMPVITPASPSPKGADAHLREITYDPHSVVAVPVKRGMVSLVLLDADESIAEIAAGLGGDCSKPDAAWCIAAQPGGRTVFIKPKSSAAAPNNLAIVTNQRIHNLRLQVLPDGDPRPPLYRLTITAPVPRRSSEQAGALPEDLSPIGRSMQVLRQAEAYMQALVQERLAAPISADQQVSERLQAKAAVVNTRYSLAEGKNSEDIVPTLVFDDGRFTYLRLPGNREMPAVFQVLGDGTEALVNTRVEDDLLVIDRVARQLVLRAGSAVVGLWNEAFDIDGVPPYQGTTVPGVHRALRGPRPSRTP